MDFNELEEDKDMDVQSEASFYFSKIINNNTPDDTQFNDFEEGKPDDYSQMYHPSQSLKSSAMITTDNDPMLVGNSDYLPSEMFEYKLNSQDGEQSVIEVANNQEQYYKELYGNIVNELANDENKAVPDDVFKDEKNWPSYASSFDTTNLKNRKPKKFLSKKLFPYRLWSTVNECKSGSITWSQSGFVFNPSAFKDEYLGTNPFRENLSKNINSFIRQLHLYRFKKVYKRVPEGEKSKSTHQEYEHPYFKPGRRDLLKYVRRNSKINVTNNNEERGNLESSSQ